MVDWTVVVVETSSALLHRTVVHRGDTLEGPIHPRGFAEFRVEFARASVDERLRNKDANKSQPTFDQLGPRVVWPMLDLPKP